MVFGVRVTRRRKVHKYLSERAFREWNVPQHMSEGRSASRSGKRSKPCLATARVLSSRGKIEYVLPGSRTIPSTLPIRTLTSQNVLGMKEQDAGLLKILGPLAGEALRLSGYDKNGVSVALNPVDSRISEVGQAVPFEANDIEAVFTVLREGRTLLCSST